MNSIEPQPSLPSDADPLSAAHDAMPLTSAHAHGAHDRNSLRHKAALTLGALGVVFGDIGTSPLYAMRETAMATGGAVPSEAAIMGGLCMIFWALVIVVTVKYVTLIMRADNNGEGGVLALATLAHRSPGIGRRIKTIIGIGAIIGLALFYGDGMLTPAITVLSAVEGISAQGHAVQHLVVPLTLAILIGLFAMQSRGTAHIGRLFGPVMVLWFAVLAIFGFVSILQAPRILTAVLPTYAFHLVASEPWTAFVSLGSVVLAVTGCEALYADMGHFGRGPIQFAWFGIVLPALLLTYFGQGAALLVDPHKADIAFYSIIPTWAHFPMVLLSTIAGIIASQAVISGVFSMTRQAVQLGQLPRMEIRHTSATEYGQIYVPRMNALLCIGVVLIVLIFKSSASLAAAYGIAVAGVMVIDTFHAGIVATRQWNWNFRLVLVLFGLLAAVDWAFLASNSLKIVEGGWLPLAIAAAVFLVMETWRKGRRQHQDIVRAESMPLDLFLQRADKTPVRVAGTAVFLNARTDVVPGSLLHNLKHNRVLHERVVLCHVIVDDTPFVAAARRVEVIKLGKGFYSVKVHHGFFETPDVPKALEAARPFGLVIDVDHTTFFVGRETLVPSNHPALGRWRTWLYIQLAGNALAPARFYCLPANRVVELGAQITI
ncbi:MAG TPA: potassium transporter Kup [Rhizomicrobium sp.]|nr:potassium transporter Kup [Rhizomicrobium sp.]